MATFRPLDLATNAADMARLYSYTVVEPITAETVCDWWTVREGEIRVTTLALNENGQVMGYWDVDHETWMKPGHFYIKVVLAPEERGRGLGTQMYEDALQVAREHAATLLKTSVREDDLQSLQWTAKRGFKLERHIFESTLDLTTFSERRFDDLMKDIQEAGFRFFSLAEAGLTDENKHRLYELNCAAAMDNPGNDRIFPDYSAFSKNVFEAAWFRAETQILASYGDQWVGLSAIGIYPDHHAYNAFTGILREYRGRGLAQALKLQTILLAKRAGVRTIRTHNDSSNRSMVAINRKLGYRPEPGYYELSCTLHPTVGTHVESA